MRFFFIIIAVSLFGCDSSQIPQAVPTPTTATTSSATTSATTSSTHANHAPTLDGPSTKSGSESALLQIQLAANDPDNDTIVLKCETCPVLSSLSSSGLFSWTPSYSDAGTYTFSFSATDGPTKTFKSTIVTIANVNRAPTLDPINSASVNEASSFSITPTYSDPDGDAITLSITSSLPSNSSFNGTTLSFSPTYGQSGIYTFAFRVSDGSLTNSRNAVVSVNHTNRAPVFGTIGTQSYHEGDSFIFYATATDPDGDPVTLSVSNKPTNATYNTTTGEFWWMTSCTDEGVYNVTFTASDGSLSNSVTVPITINHTDCSPPTWNVNPSIVSQSSSTGTFDIGSGSDPDGLSVSYTYLREYDCVNRDWTESYDPTTRRLTVTQSYGNDGTNTHFFLFYVQDADGSRNYRYVTVIYNYGAYSVGQYAQGTTYSTTGLCSGTAYSHGPN